MLTSVRTIFKKEFRSFFVTPVGYIVVAIFLIGTALFLWVFPGNYNVLDSGYANLDGLFTFAPWLYLFLCPAVTMRLFAEERQQGTLETLLTRPISRLAIVLGKAIAGWLLVLLALLPTIVWYLSINLLAEPTWNVDAGAFWGSFIGLVLLAMVYCAIGIYGSAVSPNQMVAFVVAAALCFGLFYGPELIGSLFNNGDINQAIQNFGLHTHYKSMSRGVIDSTDLLYIAVITALFLWGTAAHIRKQ